jgi:uridine kinase
MDIKRHTPREKPISVVVWGPQGCGKTRNAARIAKALGLDTVIDDWHHTLSEPWPRQGALLLTNEEPPEWFRYPVVRYEEVIGRGAA